MDPCNAVVGVCYRLGSRRSIGLNSPNQRRLGLTLRVPEVQNERKISVVDGDAGDIDDAGDALLVGCYDTFSVLLVV